MPEQTGSTKQQRKIIEWLLILSPVVIAVLFMLPRLLSAQFGLFDDGRIIVTAEKISQGIWYTGNDSIEGRFRPFHWLWFTLSYIIGGKDPLWFYVMNMLALVFVTGGLICLVRKVGGSHIQAWLAGLIFIISGPIAESYYSTKGEVIQLFFLMLSLLLVLLYARSRKILQKIGVLGLVMLVILCANLVKETSIILLPISLLWYLAARFWPGYETDLARRSVRGAYLVANMIAVPLFFILRTWAVSLQVNTGTYTQRYSIDFNQITLSLLRWAGWLMRDFIWVVPLLVMAVVLLMIRRKFAENVLLLESFIWIGAWMGIYLPWNFMAEYYMLPFTLGLAVFSSALIVEILPALFSAGPKRWFSIFVLVLSGLLLIGTTLNMVTNARVQLAIDRANSGMLEKLAHTAETNSIIFLNFQVFTEYVSEAQTHLHTIYDRPDLGVKMLDLTTTPFQTGETVYLAVPYISNQPLLTVRMGVIESSQNIWNDRLEEYFANYPDWREIYSVEEQLILSNINYPRLFCPFIKTRTFCATPAPFVDTRPFVYGWKIYKLEKP